MTPNDMSVIYVAFYKGKRGSKSYYTSPRKIYANVLKNNQNLLEESVGKFRDYDLALTIPISDELLTINENCVFWVDIIPNDSGDNYDFKAKQPGERVGNDITIYCESIASNNATLYYSDNDKDIFEFKIQYDKSKNKAIVRFDTYIPFNEDCKIWNKKPASASDNTNRIVYDDKILSGNSYIIEFKNYESNG